MLDARSLTLFSLVLLAGAFACSSAEPASSLRDDEVHYDEVDTQSPRFGRDGSVFDSSPAPDSGLGVLRFMPETVYSGVDGVHAFVVPIAVYDASGDLTVTADDPSAATIAPATLDLAGDSGKYFLVTLKSSLELPALQRLIALLGSPAWAQTLATLPGYRASDTGTVLPLTKVLPWWTYRSRH